MRGAGVGRGDERLLLDEPAVPLNEVDEQIEGLRREGHDAAVTHEQALGRVESERAELVDGVHLAIRDSA
jgi:hypothetical protein